MEPEGVELRGWSQKGWGRGVEPERVGQKERATPISNPYTLSIISQASFPVSRTTFMV